MSIQTILGILKQYCTFLSDSWFIVSQDWWIQAIRINKFKIFKAYEHEPNFDEKPNELEPSSNPDFQMWIRARTSLNTKISARRYTNHSAYNAAEHIV